MGRKKGKKKDGHAAPAFDAATLSEAHALQAQELEVLQAIFDQDLTQQSSTPLYTYIFAIRLQCEATPGSATTTTAEVLLHFDLSRAYPLKQPPNISVEPKHGLSDTETAKLTRGMEQLALEKVGDASVYDLVVFATEFIQDHLKDQSSFFDQMMTRQQDMETKEKMAEDALQQQEEEHARAKNEEILALIEAERKKRESIKKTRRRRRRHRSSIDGEDDGSDGDSRDGLESAPSTYDRQTEDSSRKDGSSDSDSDMSELDAMAAAERYQSRYHGDFHELGLLGRGGGGEVVKVRNRLDRQLYAVKKIKLDPDDKTMKKKILREVKTISRIQHRHIVRYFQAWIEGESGMPSGDEGNSSLGESDESDDDSVLGGAVESSGKEDIYGDASLSSGIEDAMGALTSTDEDEDDWLGTMGSSTGLWSSSRQENHSLRSNSHTFQLSSSHHFTSQNYPDDGFEWEALEEAPMEDGEDSSENESDDFQPKLLSHKSPVPARTRKFEKLYIQMEYCGGNALREVIDKGALWKDPDKIWTMFRQILEALVYIHRQGIIHRDIKPPNVFLDSEGTVKLGDFGLAVRPPKVLEGDDNSNGDSSPPGETATGAILSESTGSSAAELYGRLKMENLESTRVIGPASSNLMTTMSADVGDGSITAGVGTAFYRAPEQERVGQRYNQKADLFSLGILFFEMWSPPFTTLMERAQALTRLRERHELPTGFNVPDDVKKIILWLCDGDPSKRPNAKDLLASPLLPAKTEVEGSYLREALETLANPQGKFFCQLIDALIDQEPVNHVNYTYDHLESVKMRSYEIQLRTKTYVKNVLQKVFERHGAVEMTTPLLMPRLSEQIFNGINLTAPPNASMMLDNNGVAVSLPFDLTERLARFVARHNVTRLKCFQFDRVYRRSVGGGHPREFTESDFDIIWDDGGSFRFLELEGLQVVSGVIKALPSCLGSYYLRFNDARMTRGILELCRVPASARREVQRLLSNEVSFFVHAGPPSTQAPSLKSGRWKYVAKRMKHYGAPAGTIESLKPFFLLPEDCLTSLDVIELEVQKLFARNRTLASRDSLSAAGGDAESVALADRKQIQKRDAQLRRIVKDVSEGIASLRLLLQGMQYLQLSGPVCTRLDLGLSPRPERYTSGFIFQAILLEEEETYGGNNGKNASSSLLVAATDNQIIIAEGGRYDALVSRFKLTTAYVKASSVAAMGVRFAIDKIVSLVAEAMCPDLLEFKAPASDVLTGGRKVLICSAGKASDTMLFRMQIAMLLWAQGICADYLHPEPLHLEDLEDYCAQQNVHWMVIVQKHMMREKQQVKIRAVKSHSEADVVVNVTSLPEYVSELLVTSGKNTHSDIRAGIRGNNFGDSINNNSSGSGGGSSSASSSTMQPIFDVKVVDAKYQSRDKNYRNYQLDTQKVTRRVSKWIASSFSSRGDEAMKVLSLDLPFALVREMSSALMEDGRDGIDTVCANNPRYRKQLKYTMEELVALTPEPNSRVVRERYVLLHSMVDDRYDMMSLAPQSKSGRKLIAGSRRN